MADFLPPYGIPPTLANPSDAAPPDWRDGAPFPAWLQTRLAFFTEYLWPQWLAGQWQGQAALHMMDRTRTDLEILQRIRASGHSRPLDALPNSSRRHLDCAPHSTLFKEEDEGPGRPGEALRLYDRDVNRELLEAMPRLFQRGNGRKFPTGAIYWFKHRLQRPRPYQAGLLLNMPFNHDAAKSALHPSMISGHGIQGICMLMGVAERLTLDGIQLSGESWDAVLQYGIDFGDRRVMAGVHYPSDNLSSWILALDLVPRTVDPSVSQEVKQIVWRAIRGHSLVYRELDALPDAQKALFAAAWAELHRLAP